jgi:hypothetical protein
LKAPLNKQRIKYKLGELVFGVLATDVSRWDIQNISQTIDNN